MKWKWQHFFFEPSLDTTQFTLLEIKFAAWPSFFGRQFFLFQDISDKLIFKQSWTFLRCHVLELTFPEKKSSKKGENAFAITKEEKHRYFSLLFLLESIFFLWNHLNWFIGPHGKDLPNWPHGIHTKFPWWGAFLTGVDVKRQNIVWRVSQTKLQIECWRQYLKI